jgi:hypothetical protein
MANGVSLYHQAIEVSQDYLGPAAERFMARQIQTHLKKKPESLTSKDLINLVNWIKPTFALLTNDTKLVDSFIKRLLALVDKPKPKRKRS